MAATPERIRVLLDEAKAARAALDTATARAAYAHSFEDARSTGDTVLMCEAALGLAGVQAYGVHAGRVPAYLFEAYQVATGADRVRLAVAIARTWAYSGDPSRGAPFAEAAIAASRELGDPALIAETLDAALIVNWGPDNFADRLRITAQLEDTVAYVADVEARMSAHLWRLTTAVESMDASVARRQLTALERLADETDSSRVRFLERSRQGMYALVVGDIDAARRFRAESIEAGSAAGEADVPAVDHVLAGEIARQTGDVDALLYEAACHEEFGTNEGVPVVLAEAAGLWLAGGELDRAHALLLRVADGGLSALPRELDWLLEVTQLTSVAAGTGELQLAAEGLQLLEPYAGRGVPNGSALLFSGVVDVFLAQAAAAVGRPADAARWGASGAAHAERFGSVWWTKQARAVEGVAADPAPGPTGVITAVLRPGPGGVWTVGRMTAELPLRDMKGLGYLRQLVRRPGVEVAALELSDWAAGHPGAGVADSASEPILDRRALSAYRDRLAELRRELDEADEWADPVRLERLQDERDALLAELRAATGLGGRSRAVPGGAAERARVAVRKAVAAAIERIAELDPLLGRVLSDTVRTGSYCSYQPDPSRPVVWLTD